MQCTAIQLYTLALGLGECHMEASPQTGLPNFQITEPRRENFLKLNAKLGVCSSTFFSKEDVCLLFQFPKGPSSQHPRLTLSPESRIESGERPWESLGRSSKVSGDTVTSHSIPQKLD